MKVLMFGWEFPPHISGGLGTASFGLTQGLLAHGVEIIFVVPKTTRDENGNIVKNRQRTDLPPIHMLDASDVSIDVNYHQYKEMWEGVTYLEVGVTLLPYLSPEQYERAVAAEPKKTTEEASVTISSEKYPFTGGYGPNLMKEISRYSLVAAEIARKFDFDLIHVHDWMTYPAGIAAKFASGKPLVAHIHATEFDRSGLNINQIVYDIERSGMQSADRVIAVSNLTRQTVTERYGIDPVKVQTVHNAVMPRTINQNGYEKKVSEKVVTFLGRITFQKGPEYFIEAAYKILQKDRNIRFVMAGNGDMLYRMIKRVAQLRISDRFHFTGFLKGDDVDRMFGMSDVYVMPSVSEPFGISPLEAMRSSVPVIISRQSGVAEILQHALKVDFWDVDAMADAIYGLCKYDALSSTFARFGKVEVDNLKWDHAAVRVNQIYKEVAR